jgi:hypothetical protein
MRMHLNIYSVNGGVYNYIAKLLINLNRVDSDILTRIALCCTRNW